jgi:hypothetical protein
MGGMNKLTLWFLSSRYVSLNMEEGMTRRHMSPEIVTAGPRNPPAGLGAGLERHFVLCVQEHPTAPTSQGPSFSVPSGMPGDR